MRTLAQPSHVEGPCTCLRCAARELLLELVTLKSYELCVWKLHAVPAMSSRIGLDSLKPPRHTRVSAAQSRPLPKSTAR